MPYDPRWPEYFAIHKAKIEVALGDIAIRIEHVGSTSVPNLAAKPIVDIVVEVPAASEENSYLKQMEAAGYVLRVREPDWHEHRMFRTRELDAHIHFFSRRSAEIERNLAFRDHLRSSPKDQKIYENVKVELARRNWSNMNAYANAKSYIIQDILSHSSKGP